MRQKAPSAKRCIKTCLRRRLRSRWPRQVRKHRAPKGALRPSEAKAPTAAPIKVRKHRAPKGALRQDILRIVRDNLEGQKAPSAKRCIKTGRLPRRGVCVSPVRKHRTPKGALRQSTRIRLILSDSLVRKHRAPKGALRPVCGGVSRNDSL